MKLIYFTQTYPFGNSLEWKTNEINVLKNIFSEIVVIPFYSNEKKANLIFEESVSVEKPLLLSNPLDSTAFDKISSIIKSSFFKDFLKEGVENEVFFSTSKFKYWILESYKISKLLTNIRFLKLHKELDSSNTIFYSYWGRDTILALMFLKTKGKLVSRFHGYDLYPERNMANYLPYQLRLLKSLDMSVPCSKHGQNKLFSISANLNLNTFVGRLGTISKGKTPQYSNREYFNIVSCSSLIPLKRVLLIAKALKFADIKIEWTHIGEGSEKIKLEEEILKISKNNNVKINLLGYIQPQEVLDVYTSKRFDLFINVSEYEGVPVSIMEALASGIPVLAPPINGIPEIIDDKVGFLFKNENLDPMAIWEKIKVISLLDLEILNEKSKNAIFRYNEKCNAVLNAKLLAQKLLEL